MSADAGIERLRALASERARQHAAALAGEQAAAARVTAAREDLAAEFGVSTAQDARAALSDLEQRLGEEAAMVERMLAASGEGQ